MKQPSDSHITIKRTIMASSLLLPSKLISLSDHQDLFTIALKSHDEQ